MVDNKQGKYERVAKLSSLLAHPVRLTILDMLRHRNEMSVEDMRHTLDLPKANVSRHLGELRRKKLVTVRREGRSKIYALGHPDIAELCRVLHTLCDAMDPSP